MVKHGFGKLASLEKARKIIYSLAPKLGNESLDLKSCLGRILADDIKAAIDVPHFRKSAMDGYAVIAEDTYGAGENNPKRFEQIEKIKIGSIPQKKIETGICSEIVTGAALPLGADSVVMVEYTEAHDKILVRKPVAPGANVIEIGSDIKKGDLVAKKGAKITPEIIGVLASQGLKSVNVVKMPRIAYFSTGNEILTHDQELKNGMVYDINSFTVTSALASDSCIVNYLGIVDDDKKKISAMISKGMESDIVIFSGGSSLGDEDYMLDAVAELGEVLVHGIAVKPGKPVVIGKVKDKLILGLPGYPTSALSNYYILVRPLIDHITGQCRRKRTVNAKLSRKVVSTIGRYQFLPVYLDSGMAIPIIKGSSSITTLSMADGFVEISENTEVLEKDTIVEVNLFG